MTTDNITADRIQDFLLDLVHVNGPEARCPQPPALAEELDRLGVEPGMPVLLATPNGTEFVSLLFALLELGAVPVPVAPSTPPARLERMAGALGAGALVAPSIPPELQDTDRPHPILGIAKLVFFRDVQPHRHNPGEVILLTSGTSGAFSGCLHRMESLLLNAARHAEAIGQTAADSVLINLPLHYSYAFTAQLLATLVTGGRAIITGPPFVPASYARTIQQHQVAVSSLTPAVVGSIRRVGGHFPDRLRVLTVGGDALAPRSVTELLQRNPGLELYLTYGLTEAGPRVSTLAAHREPARRHSSVGLPLPGVRTFLRKVDPADAVGELLVKTDTRMLGRVGIAHAPSNSTVESRTVIRTGDLFSVDADGYLYFHERRSTCIISRGEKVYLQSVREAAERIPGVATAEPWVHQNSSGDSVFTLDVYRDGTVPVDELEIRQHLARILLRGERPARVLVHPASHLGWRKSAGM